MTNRSAAEKAAREIHKLNVNTALIQQCLPCSDECPSCIKHLADIIERACGQDAVHKYSGWPGKTFCGAEGVSTIKSDQVTCPECVHPKLCAICSHRLVPPEKGKICGDCLADELRACGETAWVSVGRLERELQVAHNVLRQHGVQCSLTNPMCDVCAKVEAVMTRLSSQEGK